MRLIEDTPIFFSPTFFSFAATVFVVFLGVFSGLCSEVKSLALDLFCSLSFL